VCKEVTKKIRARLNTAVGKLRETLSHQEQPENLRENGKFLVDDDDLKTEMQPSFGTLKDFYEGLDNYLGLPHPRTLEAMTHEHLHAEDSNVEFVTKNYGGVRTTPALEFEFVMYPDQGE